MTPIVIVMNKWFNCQPVRALGRVHQELDLQEFAQFFACFQPSDESTSPQWGNRWSRMTELETSFFPMCVIDCRYFIGIYTVHWCSIRAVNRCWCQVTSATNICVDNLRVAERKMWRSCQLRRENESEEWLRWPWLLTSEDGYPEPAEHRGLDTRGWRDTNTITTYLVHDLE